MNLPVHPTIVDSSNFVQDPPNQYPNFPQVPVPASIGSQAPFVLGLAAMFIQQNSQANVARTFFSNLVSRNGWQNQEAALLASTLFEFVDFALQTSGNNVNKTQVVEEMVGATVQMMAALYTSNYQNDLGQYMTPQLGNMLNDLLTRYQNLRGEIQQFHQRLLYQQQQMNQGGYAQPINNGGYGGGGGGYNSNPATVSSGYPVRTGGMGMHNVGGMGGSSLEIRSRIDQSKPGFTASAAGGYGPAASAPLSGRYGNTIVPPAPSNVAEPRTRITEVSGGPGVPTVVRSEVVPTADPGTVVINGRVFREVGTAAAMPTPAPAVEAPDFVVTNPEDPYAEVVWKDGSVFRPACISGWKKDRTSKSPYNVAYNPKTHVLFHLKTNDGVVHETTEEITENMERYVDHELNPQLRDEEQRRLNAKEGKSLVDWSSMIDLTPTTGKPFSVHKDPEPSAEGEDDAETVQADAPMVAISEVISAHDVRSAETLAMIQYPELQAMAKTSAFEFYGEAVSLRITSNEMVPVMEELYNCTSFIALTEKLRSARKKFPEDAVIFDEIETRLTKSINRLLNVGFAIPWTIDSFDEDAVALNGALFEKYGEDVADQYKGLEVFVIEQALCTAGADAAGQVAEEAPDPEAAGESSQPLIAFANRFSVTRVPYIFADLNVAFKGTAVVEHSALPELHKLISSIFARTQDWPVTFTDRYIKTADGVWLSLDLARLNEGAYLITKHTF